MLAGTRGRSRALLGTASAIALATGLGLAPTSARAQVQTISVSTSFFQVSVDADIGATGFDIVAPAVVSASNSTPAFWVDVPISDGVTVSAGGAIDSDTLNENATALLVGADTDGGVENGGTISASALTDTNGGVEARAVHVAPGVTVTGGVVNNEGGSITAYAGPGEFSTGNDWSAQAIHLEEAVVEDGIENAGFIGATAGEIVVLDGNDSFILDARARGIEADDSEIEGDVVNLGSIEASATAFVDFGTELIGGGSDSISPYSDTGASAVGVDLEGELDGAFTNQGSVMASALAGSDSDSSSNGAGNVTVAVNQFAGYSVGEAAGVLLDLGENGVAFDGFLNSGSIGADAESGVHVGSSVVAGEEARSYSFLAGFSGAAATGVGISVDDGLVLGSIVNDADGDIRARADAARSVDSYASSDAAYANSTASTFGESIAEAVGLELRLDGISGNVTNDGSVIAEAYASLTGESHAEATGEPGEFSSASVVGETTIDGVVEATARGGILISDLVLGDVGVGATGGFGALADARMEASASAEGGDYGSLAIATLSGESATFASAIGYYVNVETITGDYLNDGTLIGEAAATSRADANAVATNSGVYARAESEDAASEARGNVVVVDVLTGRLANSSGESIEAYASGVSAATAAASGGEYGEAVAISGNGEAGAVGLWVISDGVLGEGVENSGAIVAVADALSWASASNSTSQYLGSALAASDLAHADAEGLLIEAEQIVGDVANSGLIVADALGESVASVDLTSGGEGGAGEAFSGTAYAHAVGQAMLGGVVAGEVINSGTVFADAVANSSASLLMSSDDGLFGSVGVGYAEANAAGMTLLSETLLGGVHNAAGGVIRAEAAASAVGEAVATHTGASEAFLEVFSERGGADARATGLQVHGGTPFYFGEGNLLGNLHNEGIVSAVASAESEAAADLTAAGPDAFAIANSEWADADALGAGIFSDVLSGDVINDGSLFGEAFATTEASATVSGPGEVLAVSSAGGLYARGTGLTVAVFDLSGDVFNSDAIVGTAVGGIVSTAEATSGESGLATALARGNLVDVEANGVVVAALDSFASDLLNEVGGVILADAEFFGSSSATAGGGLFGEAEAVASYGEVFATGIDLYVEDGVLLGDVRNDGIVSAAAEARIESVATASGEFAAVAYALGEGVFVDAAGIDIDADNAFAGELVNSGVVEGFGAVSVAAEAQASGDSLNTARASTVFTEVESTGYEISADLFEGQFLNSGLVAARAQSEGGLTADAFGGELGEALASRDFVVAVDAVGVSLDDVEQAIALLSNAATGEITAFAGHSGEIHADAQGEYEALAAAQGDWIDVYSAGLSQSEGSLFSGEVLNEGLVESVAQLSDRVTANATAGEFGSSQSFAGLLEVESDAEGINLEVGTLLGDVGNNGTLTAWSAIDLSIGSTATAGNIADAESQFGYVDSDVEGFDLFAGEVFDGDVSNGPLGVLAAVANSTVDLQAQATGGFAGEAEALGEVVVSNSDGIEIDAAVFTGEVTNDGSLLGEAVVQATLAATAGGAEEAAAFAGVGLVDADADGLDIEADNLFDGEVANSGTITGRAAAGVDLVANANAGEGGDAASEARLGFLESFGSALEMTGEQIEGDIVNDGVLSAFGSADVALGTTASGLRARAQAAAQTLATGATGLDIDDYTALISGDLVNGLEGDIFATATMSGALTATATGGEAAEAAFNLGGAVASAVGIEVESDQLFGDILNAGLIQAVAGNEMLGEAVATGGDGSAGASADMDFVSTGAFGIAFVGDDGVGQGTLSGGIENSGTILALANGPFEASATASGGDDASASARAGGDSGAFGLFTLAEEVSGDILNSGVIGVAAVESGTVAATATAGEGATAAAEGYADALAMGMKTVLTSQGGDLGNQLGGEIEALADVTLTVTATATGEFDEAFALADGRAYAAGIDLHTDMTYPGSALGGEAGSTLEGQLFNHGSIAVQSLSDVTVGGSGFGEASALSIAQGIGAVVEAIALGVENSGTIVSRSDATASLSDSFGEGGGQAGVRSLAYGILLLGPAGEGSDIFELPAPPSPLGTIGDGDEDGIAIENSGIVIAMADGTAVGEGNDAFGSSYAAALQVGRGIDGEILGEALIDDGFGGSGLIVAGDIVNSGTLSAFADGQAGSGEAGGGYDANAVGLGLFGSVVEGAVNNSGTISAATGENASFGYAVGIVVDRSVVTDAINNTGLVMATAAGEYGRADAINTVDAGAGTIINLLDGSAPNDQLDPSIDPNFDGDNPLGVFGDIRLSRLYADTVNWSGGDIQGDIYGNWGEFLGQQQEPVGSPVQDDVLNVFAGASDVFDFDGDIYGLYQINVNTGEAAAPVELTLRGFVGETSELNVNDNGTLVIGAANPALVGHGEVWVETYNHAADGTLLFELTPDPDDVGFIVASAVNTLNIEGGIIGIRPRFGGVYADETVYEVIYSENRVGEFDGTYSPTPLLDVAVEYGDYDGAPGEGESDPGDVNDVPDFDEDDSDVRLRVTRNAFDSLDGLTPNQRAVGGGIENVYGPDIEDTPFGDGVSLLFLLDEEEYREALSTLHGAEHAQLSRLTDYLAGLYHDWLSKRLAEGRSDDQSAAGTISYVWDPRAEQLAGVEGTERNAAAPQLAQAGQGHRSAGSFSVWTNGGGLWGTADGDPANDVVGFDQDTWGVMLGADYQIDRNWLVGIGGVYQDSNVDFEDGDQAEIDGFQVGGFVTYTADSGFYGDGSFSVGWFDYDTQRQVQIGPFLQSTAEGETDAFVFTGALEFGYIWQAGGFLFQPLAGLEYTHASIDGFTETGADPFNLVVSDRDADSLESRLGFVASTELDLGGMMLVPEVRAEWRHEFLDDNDEVTAAFVGQPGSSFTAIGSEFGRDAAVVGAGLTLRVTDSIDAFVDYDGRFQSDYQAHAISGGLRFSW